MLMFYLSTKTCQALLLQRWGRWCLAMQRNHCSLYNSLLQQERPRHLKPTPKHSLTSLTPLVSLSSIFSHLLFQEFQDLAGFTEPIQCNIILFCLEIWWGCMESSFQNMLTLGCSQVQRRHACIWNSSEKLNSSYSDLNLIFNDLYPLCAPLETWMWLYPISHLGEVS